MLLRKLRDTVAVKRLTDSGGPRSTCSKENVDLVHTLQISRNGPWKFDNPLSCDENYHHEFGSCLFIGILFNMQKCIEFEHSTLSRYAATYFRCGSNVTQCFVANLTDFPAIKNFENRLRFVAIIVTREWRIFETQCSLKDWMKDTR